MDRLDQNMSSNILEEKDCIMSMPLDKCLESQPEIKVRKKRKTTSTPELVAPNKKKISSGKSTSSREYIRTTRSSKTSAQGSTSRGKDCVPFWTDCTKAWSEKLWSCTKTDCRDLQQVSWNTSLNKLALNSWFTVQAKTCQGLTTLPTTYLQSPPSLSQVIMEKEALNIDVLENEKKRLKTEKFENKMKVKIMKNQTERKKKMEMVKKKCAKDKTILKTEVVQKDMDVEEKKENFTNPLRARRIRIHPTKEQEKTLNDWFGAVRFVYNKGVEETRKPNILFKELKVKALRKRFMSTPFIKEEKHIWLEKVPYDVRDNAIQDLDKARKAHFAKLRNARSVNPSATLKCHFKFRTKRDKQQSLVIRSRNWNNNRGMFAPLFGSSVMKAAEKLPEHLISDFRVLKDRLCHYYLCIPRQVEKRSESQAPTSQQSVVALDPGVRTFQTCYDADGLITEWGKGDMINIFKECHTSDRLQSRMSHTKDRVKRRKQRLAWLRKLQSIRYKIDEVHKKMSTWLCTNYRVVLIPKFDTKNMIKKANRKINSTTARGMCSWAHYRFRQMLLSKVELYPWCKVIVVDEYYTTKTCGGCGILNNTIGAKKTFYCKECHYVADRDMNAARNILLRYLTRKIGSPSCTGGPMPLGAY
jgi:putative transposase